MKHIMLDLETVASTSNAGVLSLGACSFDPYGNIGSHFYAVFDVETQLKHYGRAISLSTMLWWADQSPEARAVFTDKRREPTSQGLVGFSEWFSSNEPEAVWGNGSDFDNVILLNLYDAFGLPRPWSHSKNRCFRTLKNLKFPKEFIQPTRLGTHHNALDDAVYQAQYLQSIVAALNLKL